MNYQRVYLLAMLGIGLVLALPSVPKLLATPSLSTVFVVVGGVGLGIASTYALTLEENPVGPTGPDWQFFAAIGGFVLAVVGTLIPILP